MHRFLIYHCPHYPFANKMATLLIVLLVRCIRIRSASGSFSGDEIEAILPATESQERRSTLARNASLNGAILIRQNFDRPFLTMSTVYQYDRCCPPVANSGRDSGGSANQAIIKAKTSAPDFRRRRLLLGMVGCQKCIQQFFLMGTVDSSACPGSAKYRLHNHEQLQHSFSNS